MMQLARKAGIRPPVVIIAVGVLVGIVALVSVAGILGRIDDAAIGVCTRLKANDLSTNRINAVAYAQLRQIAENVAKAGRARDAEQYADIARVPTYQPPTDCERAVHDPGHYRPHPPVPFADVPRVTLERLLTSPGQRKRSAP